MRDARELPPPLAGASRRRVSVSPPLESQLPTDHAIARIVDAKREGRERERTRERTNEWEVESERERERKECIRARRERKRRIKIIRGKGIIYRGRKREGKTGSERKRVNYVTSRRRAARSRLNKGRFFSLGSPRRGSFPIDEPSGSFLGCLRPGSCASSSHEAVSHVAAVEAWGTKDGDRIRAKESRETRRFLHARQYCWYFARQCVNNRSSSRDSFHLRSSKRESRTYILNTGIFRKEERTRPEFYDRKREDLASLKFVELCALCFAFFLYFSIPTIFLSQCATRASGLKRKKGKKEQ